MELVLEFAAVVCAGLFAGAALYVTLVEHPARMSCGTALAVKEFGPSYKRAAAMQASLAGLAFLAAIGAWIETSQAGWLIGGILIGFPIVWTVVVILPTNKKLLDPSLDGDSLTARGLLERWGRLHAVRTLVSVTAVAVLLWQLVG